MFLNNNFLIFIALFFTFSVWSADNSEKSEIADLIRDMESLHSARGIPAANQDKLLCWASNNLDKEALPLLRRLLLLLCTRPSSVSRARLGDLLIKILINIKNIMWKYESDQFEGISLLKSRSEYKSLLKRYQNKPVYSFIRDTLNSKGFDVDFEEKSEKAFIIYGKGNIFKEQSVDEPSYLDSGNNCQLPLMQIYNTNHLLEESLNINCYQTNDIYNNSQFFPMLINNNQPANYDCDPLIQYMNNACPSSLSDQVDNIYQLTQIPLAINNVPCCNNNDQNINNNILREKIEALKDDIKNKKIKFFTSKNIKKLKKYLKLEHNKFSQNCLGELLIELFNKLSLFKNNENEIAEIISDIAINIFKIINSQYPFPSLDRITLADNKFNVLKNKYNKSFYYRDIDMELKRNNLKIFIDEKMAYIAYNMDNDHETVDLEDDQLYDVNKNLEIDDIDAYKKKYNLEIKDFKLDNIETTKKFNDKQIKALYLLLDCKKIQDDFNYLNELLKLSLRQVSMYQGKIYVIKIILEKILHSMVKQKNYKSEKILSTNRRCYNKLYVKYKKKPEEIHVQIKRILKKYNFKIKFEKKEQRVCIVYRDNIDSGKDINSKKRKRDDKANENIPSKRKKPNSDQHQLAKPKEPELTDEEYNLSLLNDLDDVFDQNL